MMWQHCGRLGDHDEHTFIARQAITVESCTCDEPRCICDEPVFPRFRRRQRLRCPGKLVSSVVSDVTPEVRV